AWWTVTVMGWGGGGLRGPGKAWTDSAGLPSTARRTSPGWRRPSAGQSFVTLAMSVFPVGRCAPAKLNTKNTSTDEKITFVAGPAKIVRKRRVAGRVG